MSICSVTKTNTLFKLLINEIKTFHKCWNVLKFFIPFAWCYCYCHCLLHFILKISWTWSKEELSLTLKIWWVRISRTNRSNMGAGIFFLSFSCIINVMLACHISLPDTFTLTLSITILSFCTSLEFLSHILFCSYTQFRLHLTQFPLLTLTSTTLFLMCMLPIKKELHSQLLEFSWSAWCPSCSFVRIISIPTYKFHLGLISGSSWWNFLPF